MQPIEITKLSSRGQIVIPKIIREKLGWAAGDYVAVELQGDMAILWRLSLNDCRTGKPRSSRMSLIK